MLVYMTQDNSGLIFHGLRSIGEQQCPVTQDYYDAVSRKQPPRPRVSRPCATVHDLPPRVGIPRLGTLAQASQPRRILPRPRTMPRTLHCAAHCTVVPCSGVLSRRKARVGLVGYDFIPASRHRIEFWQPGVRPGAASDAGTVGGFGN